MTTEEQLAQDLDWAASALGSQIVDVAAVSPLRGRDVPRAAFRLTLADGRQLKLRRLRSAERVTELVRLLAALRDLGIPQVAAAGAELLVVDWLAATPLAAAANEPERIEQAAQLLAGIHATPAFEGLALPELRPSGPELLALEEEVRVLERAGSMARDTAQRLAAVIRERDPGRLACGIVHGDFCAENLVVDAGGRLRVIDNEALELGPFLRDVARVWSRWPLAEPEWARFLSAYRASGGQPIGTADLELWQLRSLVLSAWYRTKHGRAGVADVLARLRSLLERV